MQWSVALCLLLVVFSFTTNSGQIRRIRTYFDKHVKNSMKKTYTPVYHISALNGWMNDPAGFVYFQDKYHLFFQYNPYSNSWGPTHWGHVVSSNLIDWIYYPPALLPNEHYEKQGCLAGSAIVHNNYINIFYTGNVLLGNKTYQMQNIASSIDGISFQKFTSNPIIRSKSSQFSFIKNPRVFSYDHKWYMFLGSSSKDDRGCIHLYTSKDMFNWNYNGIIAISYGDMGYLWENLDIFDLNGYQILLLSVRGIQADEHRYRNLYQTGYVFCYFNYALGKFQDTEISISTFNELDHGHDFYATQTVQTPCGRRLLIGWLGLWDSEVREETNGWVGMMSMIRQISLSSSGTLLMNPITEAKELRQEILEDAIYSPGESFSAGVKHFELLVNTSYTNVKTLITFGLDQNRNFTLEYSPNSGYVSVDRDNSVDSVRKTPWYPGNQVNFRIFVDVSSIEIFCGTGEVVFSSRIYPRKTLTIHVEGEAPVHIVQYKLRKSVAYDKQLFEFIKTNAVHLGNSKSETK